MTGGDTMGETDNSLQSGSPKSADPSVEDVRAHLTHLLASPDFTQNAHRRALLAYLVEETLAGRGHLLKGFSVATAVFGRDETFDQQADPIVRIEARRLRADLERYYAGAGRADPLRISIPKGGYIPQFEWQSQTGPTNPRDARENSAPSQARSAASPDGADPQARRPMRRSVVIVASVVLGLAVGAAGLASYLRPPAAETADSGAAELAIPVIVLPSVPLGGSADGSLLAEGLTQELIVDLMRFSGLRLYATAASFRQNPDADPIALGTDLGVAYIVRGGVASDSGKVRVMADLIDAKDGRLIWSETFERALSPDAMLDVQGTVASEIATALGQSYGALKSDVLDRSAGHVEPGMTSFLCVLKARNYRRTFDESLHGQVTSCLQDAIREDPTYAEAWAMLGWLRMDEVRFNLIPAAAAAEAMNEARSAAAHAVDLEPQNVTGLQALAAIAYYSGRIAESEEQMRTALALNPNDPETLIQYGWRLSAQGKWDEGIPLVERAIARTVRPPGWYYHSLAIHRYLEGDYAGAIADAERSAENGSAVGWSVIAASNAALGNMAEAREAITSMGDSDPDMKADPAAVFRTHRIIEPTVTALVDGLKAAGWTAPRP
jgi:TolB-like protein